MDIAPRQAGYISLDGNITGMISDFAPYPSFISIKKGISLLHDEGTGGNTDGGYGNFPLFPVRNCEFESCPVQINNRKLARVPNTDGILIYSRSL